MGIEGAEHNYRINLKESGKTVTGTIYAQGRNDPLEIGTVYSPGSISGTVWLAYETTNEDGEVISDLVGLEQNFEIISGVDENGNEVNEVTFTDNNQQTTDTDIQKVQEELQQLQELENELEKQQQQKRKSESTDGGGGIFSGGQLIDGVSNQVLGIVVAALAFFGISQSSS